MSEQKIENAGIPLKYFHILPNMADDDLNPYEYRLFGHYVRVGECWESVRTTAERTGMSIGQVVDTRRSLESKSYIVCGLHSSGTVLVTVADRWMENMARYSVHQVNVDVHHTNTDVHGVNQRITIEEEPDKKDSSEISSPRPAGLPRALQFGKVAPSSGSSVRGQETSGKTPVTDLPDGHPARLLAKLVIEITGNASGCTTLSEVNRQKLEAPLKTLDGKPLPSVMELALTYPAEFRNFVQENIRACLGFDGVPKTLNKAIEFTVSRTRPRRIEVDFEERGVHLVHTPTAKQAETEDNLSDLKGGNDERFWKTLAG